MTAIQISTIALPVACDKEPIHLSGAIQPFGVLLTIDRNGLTIENASENCQSCWGISAKLLVGRSMADLVAWPTIEGLRDYLTQPDLAEQEPCVVTLCNKEKTGDAQWELSAHEQMGVLFLELEPMLPKQGKAAAIPFHRNVRHAVHGLQQAKSVQQLCDAAVREVQTMTGFDRVMLYRFDPDWHGVVISEALANGADSFLGHHFPASDIPPQARAVFLDNWLRMIPDVGYAPAPIYPGTDPANGAPLNLGRAKLRSVSPIHIEYLNNMQVKATLTISLLVDGKLWGLIACHHGETLMIDTEDRLGAQFIGQIVSAQIRVKEDHEDLDYKAQLKRVHAQLLSYMSSESDLVQGLVKYSPSLLDIAAAKGAAAAIYFEGEWTLVGKTPTVNQIERLVTWLSVAHAKEDVFHTQALSTAFPEAIDYKDVASGLLAATIPKTSRSYLLWFRPEVVSTVIWAGKPEKAVEISGDDVSLHPRKSFRTWREIISGKATAWKKVEIEAVTELRNSIIAIDLERQFAKEQAARARAEKLSKEKEDMVMVVSHDLKAPLSVLKLSFDMLRRAKSSPDKGLDQLVKTGARAAELMEKLVINILDIAKIEAETLELDLRVENINDLVHDVTDLSLPIAEQKGIALEARGTGSDCHAWCERSRIAQVLSNLVSNALKFTPSGGRIVVSANCNAGEAVFQVADSGHGIPQHNLDHIFDRFWQAKEAKRHGTGLGLSIAKGIVELHNGKIWVQSEVGVGTRFFFSLPLDSEPAQRD